MTTQKQAQLSAVIAMSLAVCAGSIQGRPPAPASASKIYTRNKTFCLPIALDNKDRARVQNVQLYVRAGPNEPWVLKDTAPPTRTEFDYSVTQDGEYWFAIVTLKKNDKLAATDLVRMVPGL